MTIEGEGTAVTGKPAGKQIIPIIPKKREFVQGILDGTGCTPCETFNEKKKERALEFLSNPKLLQDKEFSDVKSWQEYFHSISNNPAFKDLKAYHSLRYINDEDIHGAIELFLEKKSSEILAYIQQDSGRESLIDHGLLGTQRKILAWALSNEKFPQETVSQLYFDDTSAREFIKMYGRDIELELFIAIISEIESTAREVSEEDLDN